MRWIRLGASTAPTMPPSPAAIETRPICAAGTPSAIMRRRTTKKIALVTRLVSEDQSISVRKNGRRQMNRKPSASCRRRGSRCRFGAPRSVFTRLTVAHAIAKVIASTANGSHRVTAYNAPPSGPPSSEATCWRAWFWLRAVGRSSVGDDRPDRRELCGVERAGRHARDQRDHDEVGEREAAGRSRDRERGVRRAAGGAGDEHDPLAVDAVGEHAGRQQRGAQAAEVGGLDQGGGDRRAAEGVGDEGEGEHRQRAAELADGVADPEHGEVAVARELSVSGHVRTICCARNVAQ